ncbi:hypothetical protein [Streptomyces nigrescens]
MRHSVAEEEYLDGHRPVGMVAPADVARALPAPQADDLPEALSTDGRRSAARVAARAHQTWTGSAPTKPPGRLTEERVSSRACRIQ